MWWERRACLTPTRQKQPPRIYFWGRNINPQVVEAGRHPGKAQEAFPSEGCKLCHHPGGPCLQAPRSATLPLLLDRPPITPRIKIIKRGNEQNHLTPTGSTCSYCGCLMHLEASQCEHPLIRDLGPEGGTENSELPRCSQQWDNQDMVPP